MGFGKTLFVWLCAIVLAFSGTAGAFQIINEDEDPAKVVNTLSLSDSPWRSKTMIHPENFVPDRLREWSGQDFFLDEFGIPCDFSSPKVAEISLPKVAKDVHPT